MNTLVKSTNNCPIYILEQIIPITVEYINFDSKLEKGIIDVNFDIAKDIVDFFELALIMRFPINLVARASDDSFEWDDDKLMSSNTTSGFNYRTVAGTNELSLHAQGLAIDVNPMQNPCIKYFDGIETIVPKGSPYNLNRLGTLYCNHPLVKFMIGRDWDWGGDWLPESGRIDYQHFEKPIG